MAKLEQKEPSKKLFKESCFGHLVCNVEQIEICDQLVNNLLYMQVPIAAKEDMKQPMKFKFGKREITFGNVEFAIMTGLCLGNIKDAIDDLRKFDPKSPPKILKYINDDNVVPCSSEIHTIFEHLKEDTPDDVVVYTVLLLMAMQLFPKEGGATIEP